MLEAPSASLFLIIRVCCSIALINNTCRSEPCLDRQRNRHSHSLQSIAYVLVVRLTAVTLYHSRQCRDSLSHSPEAISCVRTFLVQVISKCRRASAAHTPICSKTLTRAPAAACKGGKMTDTSFSTRSPCINVFQGDPLCRGEESSGDSRKG
jgi:hypothetical protein